jgi:hypothetical protein
MSSLDIEEVQGVGEAVGGPKGTALSRMCTVETEAERRRQRRTRNKKAEP